MDRCFANCEIAGILMLGYVVLFQVAQSLNP